MVPVLILPECPFLVPLDKGNAGSGNEIAPYDKGKRRLHFCMGVSLVREKFVTSRITFEVLFTPVIII